MSTEKIVNLSDKFQNSDGNPAPTSFHCISITDFLNKLALATAGWSSVWYRGVDGDFPLLPKKLRDGELIPGGGVSYQGLSESELVDSLDQKAGFFERNVQSIDILCLAQHLGFPTRLLDWSDSLGTALYFATPHKNSKPIIWVLNPQMMNLLCHIMTTDDYDGYVQHVTIEDIIKLNEDHTNSISIYDSKHADIDKYYQICKNWEDYHIHRKYSEEEFKEKINVADGHDLPAAFYPNYLDKRLALQQAGFTIHGIVPDPLEDIAKQLHPTIKSRLLLRFSFEEQYLSREINQIRHICPTATQIFGDAEGMFKSIQDEQIWSF